MTYARLSRFLLGLVLLGQLAGFLALPAVALAACTTDVECGPSYRCEPVLAGKECVFHPELDEGTGPANQQNTPANDAAAEEAAQPAGTGEGFIPLTDLPGLRDVANSSTIPAFLNNIYKLCIGAAAVLAVLQIMRGGFTYMLGDSVTEKKEAKTLITMSVVGLLLVLSPVIVFGLIDPRILNLQINLSPLEANPPVHTGSGATCAPIEDGARMVTPELSACCAAQGHHVIYRPVSGEAQYFCIHGEEELTTNFPPGTTDINTNEEGFCANQAGCQVVRSGTQSQCRCPRVLTLEGGKSWIIMAKDVPNSCTLFEVGSYDSNEACMEARNRESGRGWGISGDYCSGVQTTREVPYSINWCDTDPASIPSS